MLKHIVMWKFKEEALGNDRASNVAKAKKLIESLNGVIAEIVELELGVNQEGLTGSYDLVLYSVFKDASGLEVYQTHPDHVAIIGFMKEVVESRACVDYIV